MSYKIIRKKLEKPTTFFIDDLTFYTKKAAQNYIKELNKPCGWKSLGPFRIEKINDKSNKH